MGSLWVGETGWAQDLQRILPQEPPIPAPETSLPVPALVAAPASPRVLIVKLRGLVFVSNPSQIGYTMKVVDGVQADGLPLLQQPEFLEKIAAFIGNPVTAETLDQITRTVVEQYRRHDRPIVDAVIPEQTINSGVLQVAVIEGHVGKVTVTGNHWFSSQRLRAEVALRPGDIIYQHPLVENLNWVNQNPFREVKVEFARGSQPGLTDVVLRTEEQFPLRVYAGYDNTGNALTGLDRWNYGFNWGNAFGLDHQLSYQFTASSDYTRFLGHSGSYTIPLPWHHTLTLMGGYVKTTANPSEAELNGFSWEVSGRYNIPLPIVDTYVQSTTLGYDFKQSNNDLEFGGENVFTHLTDVSQFMAGYNGTMTDRFGTTSIGLNLFASPGDMTENNNTVAFNDSRSGAHANYVYGQATINRVTPLPYGASWLAKGAIQDSSSNLLGSEQFGIGGADTVRGYLDHQANGDEGWLMSTEIHTPPISPLGMEPSPDFSDLINLMGQDRLEFLAFVDYGWVRNINLVAEEKADTYLLSIGPGIRYSISRYASFKLDYGFQLIDPHLGDTAHSRGNMAFTLSY